MLEAFDVDMDEDENEDEGADLRGNLHSSEQVRRQIESNDDGFVKLDIGDDCYLPRDGDWERDGRSIGNNTYIKEATIWGVDEIAEGDFENLFEGCCHNRSINKLSFYGCNLFSGRVFNILVPFFKHNSMFESLRLIGCYLDHDVLHSLTSALSEFISLKDFEFSTTDDIGASELIQAISAHLDLAQLSIYGNEIGARGCDALAALLRNPRSNLIELSLAENRINDQGMIVLATGLIGNSALKGLDLTQNCDITATGWRALFSAFRQSPNCSLEKLSLRGNQLNRDSVALLVQALPNKLKSLNLFCVVGNITPIFETLRTSNCRLEELDLCGSRLSDQAVLDLSDALMSNSTLKILRLSGNPEISIVGWHAFSLFVLQRPHPALENLDLSLAGINDEIINALTSAFVQNNKTKELDLSHNNQITTIGWENFSTVLTSPNSGLEKLDLRGNKIDDEAIASLAISVANNKKLKELLIKGHRLNLTTNFREYVSHYIDLQTPGPTITRNGWSALSQALCNTSSIMGTYNSNHTLQKLGEEYREDELPEDVRKLLDINSDNSKSEAARLKIIEHHFRQSFAVSPFLEMEWKVLPHAIAWMCRDHSHIVLEGRVFLFLRTMSLLLDVNNDSQKRKWED